MENKKQPHFPCRNCIYFNTCGESNRTEPCYGRVTKSEKQKIRETGRKNNHVTSINNIRNIFNYAKGNCKNR